MKKNSKEISKEPEIEISVNPNGFVWTGWIKPFNSSKVPEYHVIGWNFGKRFDGFHVYDIDTQGVKIECKHAPR